MTNTIPKKPANLIDAVARHKAAPSTFQIPPAEETILGLAAGDHAKIGLVLPEGTNAVFRGSPVDAERFWVKIEGVRVAGGEVTYYGMIDNDLECVPDFSYGSKIAFGPENVMQVLPQPTNRPGGLKP